MPGSREGRAPARPRGYWRTLRRIPVRSSSWCSTFPGSQSDLLVQLRTALTEFGGLGLHPLLQRQIHRLYTLGRRVVADLLGDLHRAELGATHGAEVRDLGRLLGQRLIMEGTGGIRNQTQIELGIPADPETRLAQYAIAHLRHRIA